MPTGSHLFGMWTIQILYQFSPMEITCGSLPPNLKFTVFKRIYLVLLFRPSATVSRIGLMESCLRHCHCRGGPPLAGYPLLLADPPRGGWLGRSAFALTKRTC